MQPMIKRRHKSFSCDSNTEELLSVGVGNGVVGGGGDFFVVGGDSGLVGVDGDGHVGIAPGFVD